MSVVPQNDSILFADLTVRENLYYSARLRLDPAAVSEAQCRAWVDAVIHALLLGPVAESVVGTSARRGVSGGQKKRVNIGIELVADPAVMFLDEPTSGIDATVAKSLLQTLHHVAPVEILQRNTFFRSASAL